MSKDIETRFLAIRDLYSENPQEFENSLKTHSVDYESFDMFQKIQGGLILEIHDGKIIEIKDISDDEENFSEEVDIKLPVKNLENKELFFLAPDEKGVHIIGGEKPKNFTLPTSDNLKTPFNYIGKIDTQDKYFNWINLPELFISFPLHECNNGIFLDYSDYKKPKILNPETFTDAWFDDKVQGLEFVKFKETKFTTISSKDFDWSDEFIDKYNICGVPMWIQHPHPHIPVCPKTGEVMKFVGSINSNKNIKIIENENIKNAYNNEYSDYLSFMSCGILYIWYNPNSKIIYLNIQFS